MRWVVIACIASYSIRFRMWSGPGALLADAVRSASNLLFGYSPLSIPSRLIYGDFGKNYSICLYLCSSPSSYSCVQSSVNCQICFGSTNRSKVAKKLIRSQLSPKIYLWAKYCSHILPEEKLFFSVADPFSLLRCKSPRSWCHKISYS
jgi:hypothetical protein